MTHKDLFKLLDDFQIAFELYEHPPLFTVEEASEFNRSVKGGHSKNLFLKDKKNQFFLISVIDTKRVDLKTLSKSYGNGGFSFGNTKELKAVLNLTPGSVTPYGLINDQEGKVIFLLDKDLVAKDKVNFHPLRNDMTVSVCSRDFLKFCDIIQHYPSIINIPIL